MVIFRRWLYSIKNRIWKKSLNCNKTVEKYQKLHKYCNLLNVRSSMLFSLCYCRSPNVRKHDDMSTHTYSQICIQSITFFSNAMKSEMLRELYSKWKIREKNLGKMFHKKYGWAARGRPTPERIHEIIVFSLHKSFISL